MIDISVSNLSKEFEVGKKILDGLTFQVDQGERVGLLGKNGAGKTTLFKVLTGELDWDEGEVHVAPGKGVGLISQIPVYPPAYTVEDVLQTAFDRLHAMEAEMARLAEQMGADTDPALLRRYDALTAAFEAGGGYDTQTELNKVCNGLEIYKGTVLAISHDRWFLDRVVRRVIEIHDGKAEFYAGNYSFYVEEKERRYEEKLKQYEKEQAKLEQLQEAADKLHLWAFMGNDKLHKRAFSIEKRMERIRTTDKPTKERRLDIKFGESEFRGDEVLTIKELKKSFDGRTLFDHVNLEVIGGERIALLGDNGTGKSTLLKILLGEEEPDSGKLRMGPTVKVGYLPQIIRFSHPERNLVDTMIYDQDCSTQTARNRLAAFNFRGEDVFKPVSALSGGEQSRLRLCMLMDEKINLLILDEPTNHLDVASREWIEEAVESYEGNLLFVSHDRYFINRFATRIWMLENGQIIDFRGTFEEYRAAQERKRLQAAVLVKAEPEKPKKEKPRRPGGTKELEKQVAAAERAVAKAEERQYELTLKAEEVASNYLELQKVYDEQKALEEEIAALYTKWETLAAELEEARG